MADNNYNPADNLSEEARAKGGRNSGASGAAGKTEAAKKGGKHSHGGGRRSR
ncbi:MAG TPA: stress-induced acidophilic repeat motif-containing protein [Candidatus Saccharimonadales bacterium]|nr:stress-induced acidophilic repeat motif-containing protein [Candidatus Saccharimonadales bacterium]